MMGNMIDTKLITFMKLCETKSYTKTAETLYITQPSVTHHIKALEKNYNIKHPIHR
jgi:DNA-binding transcriptional LysR family regulator